MLTVGKIVFEGKDYHSGDALWEDQTSDEPLSPESTLCIPNGSGSRFLGLE
jgi:hypothetical protein